MKLTVAFLLSSLVIYNLYLNVEAKFGNGRRRKIRLQIKQENLNEMQDGRVEFPNELQYTIDIEGEGSTDLDLVLNPYMQMPRENGMRKREYAFYTDVNTGGSYSCKVVRRNGKVNCDVAGFIAKNNETCYISPNSETSECENVFSDGELLVLDDNNQIVTSSALQPENNPSNLRKKRSSLPDPGFKVVEIAFVGDEAFMLPFYARNPNDDAAAEEEAELYVTLLANEMSVYYKSVKEVSSGQLDIVMYPAAFIHPGKGNNFAWSQNNSRNSDTELDADNSLTDFVEFAYNNITGVTFDHAMALTGLDFYIAGSGSNLLGIAYSNTVCRPNSPKVSIQENIGYNLGWIASHELGHALGYIHDESTECPTLTNIMSSILFNPSSTTKDTYNRFSSCSVNAFINHLNVYPDCTANNGFTDEQFRESFCSGLLGAADISLDRQCQVRTGSSTASACSTIASADACYLSGEVGCRSSPTGSCSTSLRHVWNGTPCGTGTGNICYRANCVPEFNICPAESTQGPNTTQSPSSTTTTQAPTTSTTTQAPSTSTTTQSPTSITTTQAPTTSTTTQSPTSITTTQAPTTSTTTQSPTSTTTTQAPTTTTTTQAPSTTTTTQAPTTTTTTQASSTTTTTQASSTTTTTQAPSTTTTTQAPSTTTSTQTPSTTTTTQAPSTTTTTQTPNTTTTTQAPSTTTTTQTPSTTTTTQTPSTTTTTQTPSTTTTTQTPSTTTTTQAPSTTTTTQTPSTTTTIPASSTTTNTQTSSTTTTTQTPCTATTTQTQSTTTTTLVPTATSNTHAPSTTSTDPSTTTTISNKCECCHKKNKLGCCKKGYRQGLTCSCCVPLTTPEPTPTCSCCRLKSERKKCCKRTSSQGLFCDCCK